MNATIRIALVIAALGVVFGPGCSLVTDVDSSGGVTETTFPAEIPLGLEEMFATCHDPLVVEDGDSDIDLKGDCTATGDLSSTEAQVMFLLMGSSSPMELGGAIPSHLATIERTIDGFPWPVQNCEIDITADAYFTRLRLYDLDSQWVTHSGKPALHIDFDFDGAQNVGQLDIDVSVHCPSGLSEWLINTFKSRVINELEGTHTIRASGMDLDMWAMLDAETYSIDGSFDLDFDVASVTLGIDWSEIDEIDRSDVEGPARSMMESAADAMLADALGDLGTTVADLVDMAIPSGHKVCSLAVSSGDLVMKTDDPGALSCIKILGPKL